jgi:hypothetical protein
MQKRRCGMALLKSTKYVCLIAATALVWLFPSIQGNPGAGLAQAAVIEGRFDTSAGSEVLGGFFASNPLPAVNTPGVDAQIQAFLQANGFQYTPLGWSFSGETRGCQDGIVFGNLYFTADPRLTAIWGADSIIFMPAGLRCGTGYGEPYFGVGEAIFVIYIGPAVSSGYYAPVEIIMWSGANVSIAAGQSEGMILRLDNVQ